MAFIFRITVFILLLYTTASAQIPCMPGDNCAAATCIFDANTLEGATWSNSGFTPGSGFQFCGAIEQDVWFPVIVADTAVTITVSSQNCLQDNGLQLALYADCTPNAPALDCYTGSSGGAGVPISISAHTNPGQVYYLMVDGYSGDVCDFTITTTGLANPNQYGMIAGRVLVDHDIDCTTSLFDTPAPGIPVTLTAQYGSTRPSGPNGQFLFAYADPGPVKVSLPTIPNNLWTVCQDEITVDPPAFPDITQLTFYLQPKVVCAEMRVDMALQPFLRPCQQFPVQLQYCNTGTVTAKDAALELIVPTIFEFGYAELPVAGQSGDTLRFDLGDVPPLHCNTFKVGLKMPCNGLDLGNTFCLAAHVRPHTYCPPPVGWSGAHVDISGRCIGDTTVAFTLKNTGTAPMADPKEYRLIENLMVVRDGQFQLNTGDSMLVGTAATGATWRLEAEQETNHPGFSMPALSLEGCADLRPGWVNAYSHNDLDDAVDIECLLIVGSIDPNFKAASPAGAGPDRLLRPNTPLEYAIHFQNTGTDTAFYVRLVDVLPPTLEVVSFRPGASSHPCYWQIRGADTLEVIFDPIILPDSNVNEAASHGWFEFSIAQKPDLPDGTVLSNSAAIYFDFNDPVITAPATHTVGQLSVSIDEPETPQLVVWKVLDNPGTAYCTLECQQPLTGKTRFELYDGQGRLLRSEIFSGGRFQIDRRGIGAGAYTFRLLTGQRMPVTGKIVFAAGN